MVRSSVGQLAPAYERYDTTTFALISMLLPRRMLRVPSPMRSKELISCGYVYSYPNTTAMKLGVTFRNYGESSPSLSTLNAEVLPYRRDDSRKREQTEQASKSCTLVSHRGEKSSSGCFCTLVRIFALICRLDIKEDLASVSASSEDLRNPILSVFSFQGSPD